MTYKFLVRFRDDQREKIQKKGEKLGSINDYLIKLVDKDRK